MIRGPNVTILWGMKRTSAFLLLVAVSLHAQMPYTPDFDYSEKEFVVAFAESFPGDRSVSSINPETGSEAIRKANKGPYYSNAELMEMLEYIDNKGVNMEIFFTYGIPFETAPDLQEMP